MPGRKSPPPLRRIVAYWRAAGETSAVLPDLAAWWIGWGEPFCFACGWLPPVPDGLEESWDLAGSWLDRAHLVDHARGGSSEPSNLVPLCHLCHDDMTVTVSFDRREPALRWVAERVSPMPLPSLWQSFTDACGATRWTSTAASNRTRLLRLRGDYLSLVLSAPAVSVT